MSKIVSNAYYSIGYAGIGRKTPPPSMRCHNAVRTWDWILVSVSNRRIGFTEPMVNVSTE